VKIIARSMTSRFHPTHPVRGKGCAGLLETSDTEPGSNALGSPPNRRSAPRTCFACRTACCWSRADGFRKSPRVTPRSSLSRQLPFNIVTVDRPYRVHASGMNQVQVKSRLGSISHLRCAPSLRKDRRSHDRRNPRSGDCGRSPSRPPNRPSAVLSTCHHDRHLRRLRGDSTSASRFQIGAAVTAILGSG